MTNDDIRRFFQEAPVRLHDNRRLREPQLQGYVHAVEHFSRSNQHAIIQLPVGCGKTGLMSILPFGLAEGRVLAIAPNLEIRKEIGRRLDFQEDECFWRIANVLDNFDDGPFRAVLDGRDANLTDCERAHFVITNIQQLASSADRWLPRFPDNFFDLILVDEAHHNVATSWQRVFDRFPNAKIVSVTATPFRSDGQEVEGQLIYRYPFAEAMRRGFIKQLHTADAAPSTIYFTYQGDDHRHTLAEVMELREEAWFRKGVALSRETNITIVESSIQHLERLRQSGFHHQIIAAACSINHAREIASLYRERNRPAEAIYSEMRKDERAGVLQRLRSGELDCIVQVGVLGEGFDHRPLSVAAIFRPYRSLSPYVQFVGRVMRVVEENNPYHANNEAFVISHVGLQQDERWREFERFDRDDQELFRQLARGERPEPEGDQEGGRRRRVRPEMQVIEEVVDRFITRDFLNPEDQGAVDEAMHQIAELLGVGAEELGLSREDLVGRLMAARQRHQMRPQPRLPLQPQNQRRELRRRLDEETRSVAGRMLRAVGLSPAAPNLSRLFPEARSSNNMGAAIRLMHRQVNETMGFPPDNRLELSIEQLEQAIEQLDEIGDVVEQRIRERSEANTHG